MPPFDVASQGKRRIGPIQKLLLAVGNTEAPKATAPAATAKPVTEDELHAILDRLDAARDIFRQTRELQEVLSRREGEIQALQEVVSRREGEIQALQEVLSRREGEIQALQEVLFRREGEIQALQEVLSRREGEIQALRSHNAELEEIMRKFTPMLMNAATTMGLAAKNEKPDTPRQP
jgi:predicted nuclease with TOPRIM domain